jgi:hypothetical protein
MTNFPQHPGSMYVYGSDATVQHGITQYYNSVNNYTLACVQIVQMVTEASAAPYRLEIARLQERTRAFIAALDAFVAAGEQATRQVEALSRAIPAPGLSHDERMALIFLIAHISERGSLPTPGEIAGLPQGG